MSDWTTTPQWRRLRREILERDGYRCLVKGPGCTHHATQVDHVVAVADGGSIFDPSNLRAACATCNSGRANRQKYHEGWRRSDTRITLVLGPPGACHQMLAYIHEHAGPQDLVIDYRALAAAIGDQPDDVRKARASLIREVQRGEVGAPRVWLTSTNPQATDLFPHHEAVVVDPGREYALANAHAGGEALVAEWYAAHERAQPATLREW